MKRLVSVLWRLSIIIQLLIVVVLCITVNIPMWIFTGKIGLSENCWISKVMNAWNDKIE